MTQQNKILIIVGLVCVVIVSLKLWQKFVKPKMQDVKCVECYKSIIASHASDSWVQMPSNFLLCVEMGCDIDWIIEKLAEEGIIINKDDLDWLYEYQEELQSSN